MDSDTALECSAVAAPYIPPELVHRILVHVGKDHNTLSSCSLVCRSWSLEAAPFIFEELIMKSPTTNLDDFADFLQTSRHVCKWVKKLAIRTIVSCTTLGRLVRHLPGLVHLEVHVVVSPLDTPEHPTDLPVSAATLNMLELTITNLDLQDICLLLGMFARIDRLSMRFLDLLMRQPIPGGLIYTIPPVQHLSVQPPVAWRYDRIESLVSTLDLSALSSLTVHNYGSKYHFLEEVAAVAEHLVELNFTGMTLVIGEPPFMWQLTKIRFCVPLTVPEHFDFNCWEVGMAQLHRAPPCLEEVHFHIDFNIASSSPSDDHDDLARMKRFLATFGFQTLAEEVENRPRLTVLHVSLSNYTRTDERGPYLKEAEEIIMAALASGSRARRLLAMSTGEPAWAAAPK